MTYPNTVISMPSQLFTMRSSFKAVANGSVYIGEVDTDPTIPTNQIQVYIEQEYGTLVPVAQPIKINSAGLLTYSGQVQKFVLTNTEYSMTVLNSFGVEEFYFNNIYDQGIATALNIEDRLLGSESEIYRGSNGLYVQNGDTIPSGTTHLINLIDEEPEIVIISPIASGLISDLTETSATIGGSSVELIPYTPLSSYNAVARFSNVDKMINGTLPNGSAFNFSSGQVVTTGVTKWLINNTYGTAVTGGLYAQPITDVFVSDFGVTGYGADESAGVQAAIDFVRSTYNNEKGFFDCALNGGGLSVTVASSINAASIRQPFFRMRNLTLHGTCVGKIVLDMLGTNSPILENIEIFGSKESTPSAGLVYGREEVSGGAPISPNVILSNVSVRGYFNRSAVVNIASEVESLDGCYFANKARNQTSCVYCCVGHGQTIVDYLPGLSSDYTTVPTASVGAMSNILHSHKLTKFERQADVVISINSISKASPAVVTVDSASLISSELANGSLIFLHDITGMTELNGQTYAVSNINTAAGTFELTYTNASPVDSTGYGTFTGGRVWNNTGPAVLLNGAHAVTWDSSYALAYGSPVVVVDTINGSQIRDCDLKFQSESQNQRVIRFDGDGSSIVVQKLKLELLNSSQTHLNSFIQLVGGGTLRIDGLTLSIASLGASPASGIFNPASGFNLRNADIYTPLEASMNPIGDFAGFTGRVFFADTNKSITYGERFDNIEFVESGTELTEAGMRHVVDSRYRVYDVTNGVERDIMVSTSYTSAQLADIAGIANTTNKYGGKPAWNVTLSRPVWATGGAAASIWVYADGTTAATPV